MSEPAPDGLCLVMIVRNEAPVIRRCLASVRPIIDHWVIVDTGSTDGTQQIVTECLAGVPGELFERPWIGFAHNRTEAIGFARGRGRGRYALVAKRAIRCFAAQTWPNRELVVVCDGEPRARCATSRWRKRAATSSASGTTTTAITQIASGRSSRICSQMAAAPAS